jgi:hypothetical protein
LLAAVVQVTTLLGKKEDKEQQQQQQPPSAEQLQQLREQVSAQGTAVKDAKAVSGGGCCICNKANVQLHACVLQQAMQQPAVNCWQVGSPAAFSLEPVLSGRAWLQPHVWANR